MERTATVRWWHERRPGLDPVVARWLPWAAALAAPPAAAAAMVPLRAHVQASELALAMVVVVALVAATGRRSVGVVAGLSAGAWFDFFLTRPYEQFAITRGQDVQTTVLLTAVAVIVGEVAARGRRARKSGQLAREEIVGFYHVSQMLSSGARPATVVGAVEEQLHELLHADCHFDAAPRPPGEPGIDRSGHVDRPLFGWDVAADGLPHRDVGLPVFHHGQYRGRFVLRNTSMGQGVGADELLVAVALADLTGAALDRPRPPTPVLN